MADADESTGSHLRARVLELEPPISANPSRIRDLGKQSLRRRKLMGIVASVSSIAFVLAGSAVLAHVSPSGDRAPTANSAAFSPDALVANLKEAVTSAQATSQLPAPSPAWVLNKTVAEQGPTAKVLRGDARARADRWEATFASGEDHRLTLILMYEARSSMADIEGDCASMVEAGFADVCEATLSRGGVPTRYVQRATYADTGGWPAVQEALPADQLWYLHQVVVYNPNGLTVYAAEVVHAPSAAAAASLWTMERDQLEAIATDPALTFPGAR